MRVPAPGERKVSFTCGMTTMTTGGLHSLCDIVLGRLGTPGDAGDWRVQLGMTVHKAFRSYLCGMYKVIRYIFYD